VTISGYDFTPQGGQSPVLSTQNGCISLYDDRIGYLPISVPLGATITAVTAHTYAGSAGAYTMTLLRQVSGSTGLAFTSLAGEPQRCERRQDHESHPGHDRDGRRR
jgi:hypothetical protein